MTVATQGSFHDERIEPFPAVWKDDDVIEIDEALVARLIHQQFPLWSHLTVRAVPVQGWDNRTFRLGDVLSVRLPSAAGYADAVEKEQRVLPFLSRGLALPVPVPVAVGLPGEGYPFPWSVLRWLPGETLSSAVTVERPQLARDLGRFLSDLRSIPARPGYAAGQHSASRGCPPSVYSDEVDAAIRSVFDRSDARLCREIWARATATVWASAPVWFHGDIAPGNVLVEDGRMSAVIDFGTCGVGDPACDLVIAWTYFREDERKHFRAAAGLDRETWQRARGWALWKALISTSDRSGPWIERGRDATLDEILTHPIT